ncbi:5,10-methylenetetrahydrofolate reductase [Escherichia coli]|uniref:5,10-methylenetetrahydrofolate reductase n=1 Tax=Escherichia coli TaxID=562 RepID=A0A376TZW7_ECOLX|nr:5,10-methylenetetrahydrofolate reductase [Escherichia coli]
MSFFHASQRDALNQSLAEVQGQINVSFEFFPRVPVKWSRPCGTPSIA